MLFAHGSRFGGHALYVKDNRLHYVNNFAGVTEQRVDATEDLPTGTNLILSASFDKDRRGPAGRRPRHALALLRRPQGRRGRDPDPAGQFSLAGEGLTVGRDSGEPVTDDYPGDAPVARSPAARCTGSPSTSAASPYLDLEREAAAMLARE